MSATRAATTLYSTGACHLCEQAEALLERARGTRPALTWEVVDISEDEQLFQRYGLHIPVLALPDGTELYWPFSDAELLAALDRAGLSGVGSRGDC